MELKYNWEKTTKVKIFLEKLHKNSQLALKVSNYSVEYANEFILDIEEFLQYIKIHYPSHFNEIFDKLTELEYISFQVPYYLNKNEEIVPDYEKMPPVINLTTKILLNPKTKEEKNLTARENRKMYLYKGIITSIIKFKNSTTRSFSKIYNENLLVRKAETELLVNNGWLLLEDALTNEFARIIVSDVLKKEIHGINTHNKTFQQEELQRKAFSILLMFGMTLSNIGSVNEHSKGIIIFSLIKKALNGNLPEEVISEYIEKNKEFELYKILYGLGLIINEIYAESGFRLIPSIKLESDEINKLHEDIIRELAKMITLEENIYTNKLNITPKKADTKTRERLLNMIQSKNISN